MIRYQPRSWSVALRVLNAVIFLGAGGYMVVLASQDVGGMRVFLFAVAGLMSLLAYQFVVTLVGWPLAIEIDRGAARIGFRYLLFRRTIALDQLKSLAVCDAMLRYPYCTYILETKGGATLVLSDLNIAHFPGPFTYNIGLDVSERLPRFLPGFRRFFHKR